MLSPVRRALTRDRLSVPPSRRRAALAAIGPLIVLAGILWALAQPDRLPLLHPDAHGRLDDPPARALPVGAGDDARGRRPPRSRAREAPTSFLAIDDAARARGVGPRVPRSRGARVAVQPLRARAPHLRVDARGRRPLPARRGLPAALAFLPPRFRGDVCRAGDRAVRFARQRPGPRQRPVDRPRRRAPLTPASPPRPGD